MSTTPTIKTDSGGFACAGDITIATIPVLDESFRQLLAESANERVEFDLSEIEHVDTAGVVYLRHMSDYAAKMGKELSYRALPPRLQNFFDFNSVATGPAAEGPIEPPHFIEQLGGRIYGLWGKLAEFCFLSVDLIWDSVAASGRRRDIRSGSFVEQATFIGLQAVPIISLTLFLVGAVFAIQSANQLRGFGFDIYVANLIGIIIFREIGPLMAAIIMSGRSSSAITAEIATMKMSEELDALRVMGVSPLRFVAVPKFWAMVVCLPLLTVIADFSAIIGGLMVGIFSLDMSSNTFIQQMASSVLPSDIVSGIVKSLIFACVITAIAVYKGFNCKQGPEGIGSATTSSVVSSLFAIIVVDLVINLLLF